MKPRGAGKEVGAGEVGHGPREIEPRFLEMLACPLTKGPLRWDPQKAELVSVAAKLAYPVRDGIPIMLPSEARQLEEDETGR
jgi:uncharacterized protein YbaR (Trm112 family)